MAQGEGALRFSLKAVCIWEAFVGRSYLTIDLGREEDVYPLLYSMYLAERGREPLPYDVFLSSIRANETLAHKLMQEASVALSVAQELSGKSAEGYEGSAATVEHSGEPARLGDLVARLIVECGISAEYVHYDMGLWELPLYLKALEEKRKEQMERERLWCFFGLLPHVSGGDFRTPQDLIRFPHERAEEEAEEAEQDALYSFFAGGGGVH